MLLIKAPSSGFKRSLCRAVATMAFTFCYVQTLTCIFCVNAALPCRELILQACFIGLS